MEGRSNLLRTMKICRFCLDESGPFTNIYEKDSRDGKQTIPLPLQIMACVAIEVFSNDGMPQFICNNCRSQTIGAYNFKTTCKKSDDALKLFLVTGNLIRPTNNKLVRTIRITETPKRTETKRKTQIIPTEEEDEDVKHSQSSHFEEIICGSNEIESNIESTEMIIDSNMVDDDSQESINMLQNTMEETCEEEEEEDEEAGDVRGLKIPQVQTDIFSCSNCDRSFPLKQLLDLHMKNHNRERSFECDDCGRKFFTKYDLAKHAQTHTGSKPFTCVVCNKQFARESLLHRHEKIHVDVPKYLCVDCDRTFLTRDDLHQHTEKHKKKRPFTCRFCKKCFVFKQGLERHELTHSEEKPHKCNYCEASFLSSIKLMRHITSHAGLRPYPCKLCGRKFLLSHHLTRHMRSHYAAKSPVVEPVGQHKCDVCSMSFRRNDSLINHSAIHSMVNLKCVICNTSFSNAKQVKEHITTHLAGLPHPCDKCEYSFESEEQLEEHTLKHAEMEYEDQIEKEVTKEELMYMEDEKCYIENEEYEEDDDDDDGVAEFTITNDNDDNPQVVRRPKRPVKIKNYAQFLKDELGSDIEGEIIVPDKITESEEEEVRDFPTESFKPIVRTEGTKMYSRKNQHEKQTAISKLPAQPFKQSQDLSFEQFGLTEQAVKNLPNKQFVDMKIGDKTVRVQKLMMTKAEIDVMARQGKIEMKGDTIILKNQASHQIRARPKILTLENIIDQQKPPPLRNLITKTYAKKPSNTVTSIPPLGASKTDIVDGSENNKV